MKELGKGSVIGFIGIGVMGRSMAGHLMEAGYSLHIYNRTKEKAKSLMDKGAIWEDSPGAVAAASDVIFTIVGFPPDVESVYLDDDGILAHAKPGSVCIDMTTSSPELAERIAAKALASDVTVLDAPVSGGDSGARDARLSIMVGGDEVAFNAVLPLFELMGKTIVHQGGPGAGQRTKMCNQIAIAAGMLGVCEALAYAETSGLDPRTVLSSISGGAAGSWSLSNLAPRILDGNFDPGFYVKHFIKDMTIAYESAKKMGLKTPGLECAKNEYEALAADGKGDLGTQALYLRYSK